MKPPTRYVLFLTISNYSNTVDPKAIGIASGTVPCMFSKPELADGVYRFCDSMGSVLCCLFETSIVDSFSAKL